MIEARDLGGLVGRSRESLATLAWQHGGPVPVPFQVDPRDRKSNYVLGTAEDPLEGPAPPGPLGPLDEVVFMAGHLGRRFAAPAGLEHAHEIEVSFGKGEPRFCWMGTWAGKERPGSTLDLVSYHNDGTQESVTTPHYVQVFSEGGLFFKDLYIAPRAGGNGSDVFDRLKMRSTTTFVGGIEISFDESDFRSSVAGVRDGPVRVIRRNRTALELFLGLKTPSVLVDALFYRDSYEVPSTLEIPFRIDLVAREMRYFQGCDLSMASGPYRFYSDQGEGPVMVDGRMSPAEREMLRAGTGHEWGLVSGRAGALAYLARWEQPDSPVGTKLYYMDDKEALDPPEDEPGLAMFAFEIVNPLELAKKAYDLNIIVYVLPGFEGGAEEEIESLRAPLEFSAARVD